MESFGERLKEFAVSNFKTVKDLADKLEISDSQLSQYITNERSPKKDFFIKIGNLGCDLNLLLTGKSYTGTLNNSQQANGERSIATRDNKNSTLHTGDKIIGNIIDNEEVYKMEIEKYKTEIDGLKKQVEREIQIAVEKERVIQSKDEHIKVLNRTIERLEEGNKV